MVCGSRPTSTYPSSVVVEAFAAEEALAEVLAGRVAARMGAGRPLTLGLPTGRTPLALYAALARMTRSHRIDWSAVRTFNLDEFVGLGAGDPHSYRTFMERHLFDHVAIPSRNVGFLDGRAVDPAVECARYERAIRAAGGLDLVLLGIGGNGHIGFNEPADALIAQTHATTLDEPTRAANAWWFGGNPAAVPHQALTMGVGTILSATEIVLMATGAAKIAPVRAMLQGPVTTRVPASLLQLHRNVRVMVDADVAAALA